jgi:hypothetical protein
LSPREAGSRSAAAPSATLPDLLDEQTYLLRSLADLDSELAAGEMAQSDYDELRAKYDKRAAEVAAALSILQRQREEATPERGQLPGRTAATRSTAGGRQRQRVVIWAAGACFVAAGLVGGLALAGVAPFARQPAPIPKSTRIEIELAEAAVLVHNKDLQQAIGVYGDVLALDPRQPEALADGGWLVRTVGLAGANPQLIASGDAQIAQAVTVAPGYQLARAYDGVVLFVDKHDAAAAVEQFDALAAAKPSASLVTLVAETASAAYKAVHRAVPAALTIHPK